MTEVNDYFENRVVEVNKYFAFLKLLDEPQVSITLPQRTQRKVMPIDSHLHRMMKASSFLVLYNLVESTIRRALTEVYERIEDKGAYANLTDKLRAEWIRQRCSPLRDPNVRSDTIESYAAQLIDEVLQGGSIKLSQRGNSLRNTGNLDAKRIRELCDRHGIALQIHYTAKGGGELRTVKTKRNSLAHGDELFSEVGRDFTYGQLDEIKRQVIVYMRSVLRSIGRFVAEGHHLRTA